MNPQEPLIQSDVLGKALGRQRLWYIGTKTTVHSTLTGYFLQYPRLTTAGPTLFPWVFFTRSFKLKDKFPYA